MVKFKMALATAAGAALLATAAPASAATVFTSTFENVPGGPTTSGSWNVVGSADGWTGGPNIELQNHAAGAPAPNGGNVFVELDTYSNSSMSRIIDAGVYTLSYLYSPRPGISSASNIIEVLLNGTVINTISGTGGSATDWQTVTVPNFTATAGSTLTFQAAGTSDSVGGYIDNISLSAAVPEPGTWLMMLVGFLAVGATLRGSARGKRELRVKYI